MEGDSGADAKETSNRGEGAQTNSSLSIAERMKKREIPAAVLVGDAEQYLTENGISVDDALRRNEENQKRYKIVECSFVESLTKLKSSIDDYERSLASINALDEQSKTGKEPVDITYKLDENLYSKATVDRLDKVCIYLGANVMVEYELQEGREMLEKNLKNINKSVATLSEELDFIRDQITVTEVNVAQLHNHRVQQSKIQQSGGKK